MTWESLKSACMGKLGLSQNEFWASSLYDLSLRLKGFYELEEDRQRSDYERDRLFTLYLLNIHIDKKHRMTKTSDLMTFPWEKSGETPVRILTPEEIQEKFEETDMKMKQKYGNG